MGDYIFANGTEGYAWMAQWCDTCVKDAPARRDDFEHGCPLVASAMVGIKPDEWTEDDVLTLGKTYTCSAYVKEGGDGDE